MPSVIRSGDDTSGPYEMRTPLIERGPKPPTGHDQHAGRLQRARHERVRVGSDIDDGVEPAHGCESRTLEMLVDGGQRDPRRLAIHAVRLGRHMRAAIHRRSPARGSASSPSATACRGRAGCTAARVRSRRRLAVWRSASRAAARVRGPTSNSSECRSRGDDRRATTRSRPVDRWKNWHL